jgi:hypothetical protein
MRSSWRFGNPVGFVLALGCFLLLPFVTVSCDTSEEAVTSARPGTVDVTYSGTDLVRGKAEVKQSGIFGFEPEQTKRIYSTVATVGTPARVLAIAVVVMLLAGAATVRIRSHRVRTMIAMGLAAAALGCVVATQIVTTHQLRSAVQRDFVPWVRELDAVKALIPRADELVRVRIGYPITAITLAGVIGLNAVVLVRDRRRPREHSGS